MILINLIGNYIPPNTALEPLRLYSLHASSENQTFSITDKLDPTTQTLRPITLAVYTAAFFILPLSLLAWPLLWIRNGNAYTRGSVVIIMSALTIMLPIAGLTLRGAIVAVPLDVNALLKIRPDFTADSLQAVYGDSLYGSFTSAVMLIVFSSLASVMETADLLLMWNAPSRYRVPNNYEPVTRNPKKARKQMPVEMLDSASALTSGYLAKIFEEHEKLRPQMRNSMTVVGC